MRFVISRTCGSVCATIFGVKPVADEPPVLRVLRRIHVDEDRAQQRHRSSGMSSMFVPPRSDENSELSDETVTMSSYRVSAQ